jgi:hypothetical protein
MSDNFKEFFKFIALWYILPAVLLWAEMHFFFYPEATQDKAFSTFLIMAPALNIYILILMSLAVLAKFVSGFIF